MLGSVISRSPASCTEQPLGHRYINLVEEERWKESDSVGETEREYTGEDKKDFVARRIHYNYFSLH